MTENFDPTERLELLVSAARKQGASGAEALFVHSKELGLTRRLGDIEHLERSETSGVGLRVFYGQQVAMASSTDLSDSALEMLVSRTLAMAKAAPADPHALTAPQKLMATEFPELDLYDTAEPDEEWLIAQCTAAEETAMATPGITNSEGADASYSASNVALVIAGNDGQHFAHDYASSYFSISASVVAGEGTRMERDYDFSSSRHRMDLTDAASIGKEAAKRTLERLNPRRVASCEVPVVFDPRVSRSLVSAFSGAINGAAIARGTSFLKDKMGTQIFAPGISIIDDPHRVRGMASKPFDGEGVANQKREMIKDGVLQSWFLDMRSAAKLGLATTGHASRGMGSPPSPSSTNLYMQAGTLSPQALISDIKSGFYVTETFGMGVSLVTGDYSQGAAGFWIENGQIAYPVSEITIAGKLGDMFAQITPANDLVFRYGTNAPTLRIDRMTVAGT